MMKTDVILHFRDGQKLEGALFRPFRSEEGEVEVSIAGDKARLIFSLEELCVILFLCNKSLPVIPALDENLEDVKVLDGELYRVYCEEDEKAVGFFAIPSNKETPWKYAYFSTHGVRLRTRTWQIGTILAKSGVVSNSAVAETLKLQENLRNRRVGEIIAEKNSISQETIEKTISASIADGSTQPNARVGDILVAAGLVTREQVEQALATQEAGRKMKIGALLVQRGLISEDQLLSALATKFCLRMVVLDQITPAHETLAIFSKGIVNLLQIFPLDSSQGMVVVATSTPTDPFIADRLRFITSRNIELVVAPAAKIAAAIDRCYNKNDARVASPPARIENPDPAIVKALQPPVDLSGEADWTGFDAPSLVGESLRFVSGDPDGNRFRVKYFKDEELHLHARIWFGPETEGPPGHAHGGSVAAVMDEALGLAAWAAGYPIVVGNLNVNFRNLLPLQKVVTVESRVVSAKGRKIMVHGRIFCEETIYAEGECLCITIPESSRPVLTETGMMPSQIL